MKNYSIGQFANELGVNVQTLRNWDKSGKLKPDYISPAGHRYYSREQLEGQLRLQGEVDVNKAREQDAVEDFIQIASVLARRMSEGDSKVVDKMLNELRRRN